MRPPLHSRFVDKAEAALVAAVEVYNKPAFAYREETFALLMINAWELLLKAKLLKDGSNKPKCIRVYEKRQTKSGKLSTKLYLRRNRAGNPMTIALGACVVKLDADAAARLSPAIKANLDALVEVRDNAAHYIHASAVLARQVLELGSAAIKNFVLLAKRWFDRDLSHSLALVLPLSFISGSLEAEGWHPKVGGNSPKAHLQRSDHREVYAARSSARGFSFNVCQPSTLRSTI
jgi:hypothetical protein